MVCWHDTKWLAYYGRRSATELVINDSDFWKGYHPNDADDRAVLEEELDFEQGDPPHSPHFQSLRELKYCNPPVFHEKRNPNRMYYLIFEMQVTRNGLAFCMAIIVLTLSLGLLNGSVQNQTLLCCSGSISERAALWQRSSFSRPICSLPSLFPSG